MPKPTLPPATALATLHTAPHTRLLALKSWQLRLLATRIGAAGAGTKAGAVDAILRAAFDEREGRGLRGYTSVDMGVKNLAFTSIATGARGEGFTLREWRRLNVLSDEGATAGEAAVESAANMYSPANLAPAAARLAQTLAVAHDPDLILVERQRFRSGGGAAVQEWTLRVNSLEAMLWASLETMRASRTRPFPATVEMSPARIAAYWNSRGNDWSLEEVGDPIPDESEKPGKKGPEEIEVAAKRGMEKAEKIAIVRNWLETGAVDVVEGLQPLANAFMSQGRASKDGSVLHVGKKDDLADCVVQGVTFGLWERNRAWLREHLTP